jgi:adenylate cyclase
MGRTIELERTFLARKMPKGIEKCRHVDIEDLYVPKSAEHPTIRIRKSGSRMEITKKQPVAGDPSEQHEHTIELDENEFQAFSRLPGKTLEKTRYFYNLNGIVAEIDVFRGALAGLVLVDFEFVSRGEMERFSAPDFCLAEVTSEVVFAGGMLCGKSYSSIEPTLKKYGYNSLP